jgi:CBS domain-containing protein
MKAKDIMTTRVVTVRPETTVQEIVSQLLAHRISAMPVVDKDDRVVGIVSEGDLIRRVETGTAPRRRSSWLELFVGDEKLAEEYAKSRGRKATDVMTKDVISVTEETSAQEIAEILETRHIKRVPVVRQGRLVGIVSRANLVQGLTKAQEVIGLEPTDEEIRQRLNSELAEQSWSHLLTTNIIVKGGIVEFWGIVGSEAEKKASRIAAENIKGVKSVIDRRAVQAMVPGYV